MSINTDTTTTGTSSTATGSTVATSDSDSMSQDDFLKILVAELKNQSPDSPADPTTMMTQEATFSQLNAIQAMAKQQSQLVTAMQSAQAGGMIGQTINASTTTNGGSPVSGVVTGVKLGTDGPTLELGDTEVSLSAVTEVTKTKTS